MSLDVLVTGCLVKPPQERESRNGKPYVLAHLVSKGARDEEDTFCSVFAYRTSDREQLLSMAIGEGVSVAGRASINTWEKAGVSKTGLTITAARLMTVGDARVNSRHEDEPAPVAAPEPALARHEAVAADGLDDDIPF